MIPHIRQSISIVQRLFDGVSSAALALATGVIIANRDVPSSIQDVLTRTGADIWSGLLLAGTLAALIGVIFRISKPGRRQTWGYGCELGGWLMSGGMIMLYAIANAVRFGTPATASSAALTVLGLLLVGKWAERVAAIAQTKAAS